MYIVFGVIQKKWEGTVINKTCYIDEQGIPDYFYFDNTLMF